MPPKVVPPLESNRSSKGKPSGFLQDSTRGRAKAAAPQKRSTELAAPSEPLRAKALKSLVLRKEWAIDSERVGDLPAGTSVLVVANRETGGVRRAHVAMSEASTPLGWVTASKDGVDNLAYETVAPAAARPASARQGKGPLPITTSASAAIAPKQSKSTPRSGGSSIASSVPGGIGGAKGSSAKGGTRDAPSARSTFAAPTKAPMRDGSDPVPGYLSGTAASSTNAAARAARRRERMKRPAAAEENTPVLVHAEDFDWARAGGGWTVEKWLGSLQLHTIVADALGIGTDEGSDLGKGASGSTGSSPFERSKRLSREDILARLNRTEFVEALVDAICSSVGELQSQAAATGDELNVKFHLEGGASFEMAFGSLDTFYGGLERLVGPPQMLLGSLSDAMEADHCSHNDATRPFTSSNGLTSCSKVEWEFVVSPVEDKAYPERRHFQKNHSERCRKRMPLDVLKGLLEKENERLSNTGHVQMIIEEVIAGRLYTGPMYEKYNAVLRKQSGVPTLIDRCTSLCGDNSYATTIHAINSCVIKLSKLTQAVKVWRGFKGATLPRQFFEPNDHGVRGGIEYGFSSTTTDREQALIYASGAQSTIFEMQMGMVDRGADLTWLSQYPHEREVLFPPLTGLEALETVVDGSTLLVITRLSLNMASLTLEQVLSRRRKTLMDMAEGMRGELRQAFAKNTKLADSGSRILANALERGVLTRPPTYFNDDEAFSHAVQQCLAAKSAVVVSSLKLPLDRAEVSLRGWKLAADCYDCRKLVLVGWLACAPAATSIDFRDVGLSADEAAAVAEALASLPHVTSINVLHNESMGADGAEAFARLISRCSGGGLRSLCGVGGGASILEVPRRELAPVDALVHAAELEQGIWAESLANEQNATRKVARLMRKVGRVDSTLSWYPLIWAAKDGNVALIEAMLTRNADVDQHETAKTEAGFTPLMCAANKGHAQAVELLLERGANPVAIDHHKRTAAQLAEARGFKAIAELIGYCAEQMRQHRAPSQSFGDTIVRASLVKTAVGNFKKSLGALAKDTPTGAVAGAASTIQKLARGRTDRKLLESAEKAVAEAPPSAMRSLAKTAMITRQVTQKLKATIVPSQSRLATVAKAEGDRRRAAAAAAAQTLADVARLAEEAASEVEPDAADEKLLQVAKAYESALESVAAATQLAGAPVPSCLLKSVSEPVVGSARQSRRAHRSMTTGDLHGQEAAAVHIQRLARGKSGRASSKRARAAEERHRIELGRVRAELGAELEAARAEVAAARQDAAEARVHAAELELMTVPERIARASQQYAATIVQKVQRGRSSRSLPSVLPAELGVGDEPIAAAPNAQPPSTKLSAADADASVSFFPSVSLPLPRSPEKIEAPAAALEISVTSEEA